LESFGATHIGTDVLAVNDPAGAIGSGDNVIEAIGANDDDACVTVGIPNGRASPAKAATPRTPRVRLGIKI